MAPTLPERLLVATSDFDEAVATMRSAFGDVDLRRGEHGESSLSLRSAGTPDLTASRWMLGGIGGGSLDQRGDEDPGVLVGVLLGGELALSTRAGEIDTARPFLYPEAVDARMSRPDVAIVLVSRAVLQERARAMTGGVGPALRFTGAAPMNGALDALWRTTTVHIARTMELLAEQQDVVLAQTALIDHVAMTMLHAFPNTALEAEDRQRIGGAQHATLRRALQYIDDHLDVPFTVPDLADASRLSLRGLHAMFRRELDTTPMAYVGAARLAAARADLLREDPLSTRVEQIASRWGFARPAHFRRRYREAFGESPAQTLAR